MKAMQLARYRFSFQVLEPLQLPAYAGSMWRGAFGRGLKQTVCVMPGQPCDRCRLRTSCLYPLFYGDEVLPSVARFASPPRPFVLEPGSAQALLSPGETVRLDVVLVAGALAALPHVVHGLRLAGQQGVSSQRSRLALVQVEQQDSGQLAQWRTILREPGALQPAPVQPVPVPSVPAQVRMELVTPLRLKRQQHLMTPRTFAFREVVVHLLRRIRVLEQLYGEVVADTVVPLPDEVFHPERRCALTWFDWQRWSNRQRTRMNFGGLLGEVELEGALLEPFWPYLWLGQWLHVGSAASFGLGQHRLVG
jgi:CRISPR/Cas system endoribonuclease Cas6 (RAMP superfamily)